MPQAAVEFLQEARRRLPGRCDAEFGEAIRHYTVVRDRLKALVDLHPERKNRDWTSKLKGPQGAQLVREAAAAERQGLAALKRILAAL